MFSLCSNISVIVQRKGRPWWIVSGLCLLALFLSLIRTAVQFTVLGLGSTLEMWNVSTGFCAHKAEFYHILRCSLLTELVTVVGTRSPYECRSLNLPLSECLLKTAIVKCNFNMRCSNRWVFNPGFRRDLCQFWRVATNIMLNDYGVQMVI